MGKINKAISVNREAAWENLYCDNPINVHSNQNGGEMKFWNHHSEISLFAL